MFLRFCYPVFVSIAAGAALAQTTTRVSVGPAGLQSDGPCLGPSMVSLDGRFVAFTGNATNLVPGDTNAHADAFVHDLATGVTTCASVSSSGVIGNASSVDPRISGDGGLVVYTSTATNLVAGDTNTRDDVFVRDRAAGTTTRINLGPGGVQANGESSFATISGDGRFVSYVTSATNLVAGDTNGLDDVLLFDRVSGVTSRVSQGIALAQPNADCWGQSISEDGRYVAYWSAASNLVAGDTNGVEDAFVCDVVTGTTTRVSVDSAGAQANGMSGHPSLSPDGRWVAFWSLASNLVPGDTNAAGDVFLHDLQTGATTRVSVSSLGVQGNGNSSAFRQPACSRDGVRVSFASLATNLVPGDTNGCHDVFVHDRTTATTERVSVSSAGVQGNSQSSPQLPTSISADGRVVGFDSNANNLVAGDTNGQYDIFVHDDAPLFVAFCAGDGVSTNCPCLNNGAAGNGCANSAFAGGARLSPSGWPSVAADSVTLSATDMTGSIAVYFQGATQVPPAIVDDGIGCVGGPIVRLRAVPIGGGASSFPQLGDPSISVRGAIPTAGGTRFYQCTYRNVSGAFCPPATSNRTNGVVITWVP